jgi:hypothetical protein
MKRVVDELTGLGSVLSAYAEKGNWPKRVYPDSIRQLLDCEELCSLELYQDIGICALRSMTCATRKAFLPE